MPALFGSAVFLSCLILSLLYMVIKLRIEYGEGEKIIIQSTILFPRLPKVKKYFAWQKLTLTNWSSEQKIKAKLLKYILIDELVWSTVIGLEDAMYTALGTGGIWACKGTLISYLKNHKRLKHFKIDVQPDFSTKILLSELECIIKLRIGHIIYIAVLWLSLRLKVRYCNRKVKAVAWLGNNINLVAERLKKWGCWHGDARGKA